MNDFRAGKIKVLVATDIAARGIDVSSISHVINYDIPVDPESYVHRIGRTARAGRDGIAISFCDSGETLQLRAVEKAIRMKIPVDNSHPFHGKAPTQDPNEGRLLSRKPMSKNSDKKETLDRNSNQRNSRDDSNKNEGFDRRKSRHDSNKIESSDRGGFDRKRSRDDRDKWSTKSTDSRSSKRGFFSKNKRSNDENYSID